MTPKPVVYAKAKSTPTALAYVAAGEWWHVHHEAIQRLIDHGWVEDNVPGTGPDRYRITFPGRVELARYQPWIRAALATPLPLHRTEAGYTNCATCDGGGCPDCTDPA